VEVGVIVVIFLLAEAIPRRRLLPERRFRVRRQPGPTIPLIVDGVVRGVEVLLGGSLAVALG